MREVMTSKIHQATVTHADVAYVGSITIAQDLLDKSGLWVGQKVLVVSNTNGARLETYTIAAEAGSGVVAMNGAAAHLIQAGHEIIVIGFSLSAVPLDSTCILVDADNRFVRYL